MMTPSQEGASPDVPSNESPGQRAHSPLIVLAPPLTGDERRQLGASRPNSRASPALGGAAFTLKPLMRREVEEAAVVALGAARNELQRWAERQIRENAFALLGVAVAVGAAAGLRP